jgi:futalosine hydrolase
VSRILVVTAVGGEADAVRQGLGGNGFVIAGGVGSAAAAASTASALAAGSFAAVVSAGIGGGIGVALGSTVVATASVAADLGADSPDGFISLDELGFGSSTVPADPGLLDRLTAALPDARVGTVLTVSTVTGTADRADHLRRRHPDAVAEAMEGFGVATAARLAGVPFGEVRTISNPVGPRDRGAWRIGDALAGLSKAFAALAELTL